MAVAQLSREQTEFVTGESLLAFANIFPGQDRDPGEGFTQGGPSNGNRSFGVELWTSDITWESPVVKAICNVARANDPVLQREPQNQAALSRHLFGQTGRIKRLSDLDQRDPAKYPKAVDKFIISIRKTVSLKTLNMENANLADPKIKERYDDGLAAQAPGASRFANTYDENDQARIRQENQDRVRRGLKPIPENEFHKALIPVMPLEIYPGCIVRAYGRVYWNAMRKTVGLALETVLLVRQEERLYVSSDPDSAFGAFAPDPGMAPPPINSSPLASLMGGSPAPNKFAGLI